ncbi:hypothetical protein [Dyella psychrodurans]|uniref:Uncharacterized protein n=1 Tax=Dyella psychrodurans TaxID=1927960 RepID=A0A370WYV4_9GAMM|nr:hypothetical protein [Dyella psychrodurans]RDS81329.1 hypothetical protein DWU99_16720 [Dyella psychrodurans]
MKNVTAWLALALLCGTAAQAQDKTAPVTVMRDYTDVVAPADQQAYEAGVKNFNQCLRQHGFKYTWTAWVHETGDTYTYSYTSDPIPWSSFDDMDAAGKACDAVLRSSINPHLKSETSAFLQVMPELSHVPKGADATPKLIEVTFFMLKPGHEAFDTFLTNTKKIAAAAEKSNWPYYFRIGQVIDAGDGAPSFVLISPSNSWAELGKDPDPSVWKMVENVYGKADGLAIRKAINDALKDVTSHVDSYSADLTYTAPAK